MNPTAIYSKSGKGVQEASGKTSLLQRADRAVLSAIDGRATLADVAQKVGKPFDAAFQTIITKLDKEGFVREVSAGAAAPAAPKPAAKPAAMKPAAKGPDSTGGDLDFSSLGGASKPANPPSRPAAPPPPKPAAPAPNFSQLDFSTLGTPSKPATPPPAPAAPAAPGAAKQQQSALTKAREEAEARAQAERDRIKAEAEAKTRTELEAKMRSEAEKKMKDEAAAKEAAAARAAAEAEARAKAAREAALKAAEAKVKAEQEAKEKIEAERKAREEMEKRLEQERKAREEAERKAKEEAERVRKEAEEKARREREEMEKRLEAERKAREEAERKAKEEAERARKEAEEKARQERAEMERRLEEERKAREEAERKASEEAERVRRELEEERKRLAADRSREDEEREARRRKEEEQAAALLAAAQARESAKAAAPKGEPKKEQSFGDSLLADLDSFTNRDEEERKAKEEDDRKAKAAAEQRRRDEEERQAKEEAERQRREDEDRRRQEEEGRRAREEEGRRAKEEERRKREAEEIRRKAAEATAAAMAKEGRAAKEEDIPISDDDLAMDEVKREQAALAKTQAKEKEEQKKREKAAEKEERRAEAQSVRIRKPIKWGSLITTTLIVVIVLGLIAVHVMPAPVADYERSAAEALGRPVKIASGHYWLLTGPEIRFSDVRIAEVAASVSPGSIFSDRKEFTRVELDGLRLPQESLAEALFATVKAENLAIDRIVVKSLELPGPAVMPKNLQADAQLDGKGALRVATLRGPDGLVARITPKEGAVDFDVVAGGFTLPIAPEITLSKFAMKGSATPRGMKVDEWGGSIFNGGIAGTASIRWGGTWTVDGVVTVRGINAAVFAPALVSNGTGEGTGRFSMSGAEPAKLATTGRLDGNFTVTQGTLGSFDLAKGIQTSGKQALGTTSFTEMTGQASYDRGAIALRNVNIGAGALNAAASADIAQSGALSGRIVADVKNAGRSQSAIINIGGTLKEPQVRN